MKNNSCFFFKKIKIKIDISINIKNYLNQCISYQQMEYFIFFIDSEPLINLKNKIQYLKLLQVIYYRTI